MRSLSSCLIAVHDALKEADVTWALGASMLLHYKGLVDEPRDIDIVLSDKDWQAADRALSALGEKQPPNPDGHYGTKHFGEYSIGGVSVDAMAGLIIRHVEGAYAYVLPDDLLEYQPVSGASIPLSPLEDWYVLYQLMPGRAHRVEVIESYFRAQGARAEVLRRRLQDPLPEAVKARLRAWM